MYLYPNEFAYMHKLQDLKTRAFKKLLQIACKIFANLLWHVKNSGTSTWSNEITIRQKLNFAFCKIKVSQFHCICWWDWRSSSLEKTKKKRNNKREFCIIIIWVAKLFEHFSSLRTFFYSCLEAIILCNFWMTSKDPHETMINLGKRHQTWPRYHFSYLLYPPAWWPRLHGCWYSKVVSDVALVRVWPLNQEMLVTYLFQLFVNLLSNCLQFTLGEWSIILSFFRQLFVYFEKLFVCYSQLFDYFS